MRLLFLCVILLAATPTKMGVSAARRGRGGATDMCAQSFCQCPQAGREVICECSTTSTKIHIGRSSLPQQTSNLVISGCGEVAFAPNSLSHLLDLDSILISDLKSLKLSTKFYSSVELEHKEVSNLTVSHIGRLEIEPQAFINFPKVTKAEFVDVGFPEVPERGLEILSDILVIKNSEIGELHKGSIYSDAGLLSIKNNRIEVIAEGAFDASVRRFEFSSNTVDLIEHNGMSVACLQGALTDNVFHNQTGSPFNDFGPDPVCMPDPDTDPYEDEEPLYNVVANPDLRFTGNFFHTYTPDLLDFPGANAVPLGSLDIRGNKFKCDCEALKDFAALVDFEHLVPRSSKLERGAILFRKEIYDSGLCVHGDGKKSDNSPGQEEGLKGFLRSYVIVSEPGEDATVKCSESPRSRLRTFRKASPGSTTTEDPDIEDISQPQKSSSETSSGVTSIYSQSAVAAILALACLLPIISTL